MVEGQAQGREIKMIFPEFDAPCFVHADRTRLKQVVINFLSNAIKYNRDQGMVEVTYAPSAQGRVRISIRDTGAGLPPEKLAQLFQPFNRLGQEAGGQEGTGIGLVVAKQLIELMDGSIGVESTVGVGSTFWFDVAAAPEPQFSVGDDERAGAITLVGLPKDNGVCVLLYVEDNRANLKLVERLIGRRPELRMMSAETGRSGIELARQCLPDVILMDINLPDISGIDAMRVLRSDPTTGGIPVIAISANAMDRDVEKGRAAGFFDYLTKPINVPEFMRTLDAALAFANGTSGGA
jgi:CheY-like chemotaxis protein/anti-sigma regulatory factor (Ser/Thr protein kinase)